MFITFSTPMTIESVISSVLNTSPAIYIDNCALHQYSSLPFVTFSFLFRSHITTGARPTSTMYLQMYGAGSRGSIGEYGNRFAVVGVLE